METFVTVLCVVCFVVAFLCFSFLGVDSIIEKGRRKKHPKWYEHYNRALSNAIMTGIALNNQLETLSAREEMVRDLFLDGKCSADEYKNAMKIIEEERVEAVEQARRSRETLGIDEDLKAADAYAKEHNLKWGIIYEDIC